MKIMSNGNVPDRGRRLLPTLIEDIAANEPNRTFFEIPNGMKISSGFRAVRARDFVRGFDRAAWWIKELLGTDDRFRTLAYMGPQDLRYTFLMFGAIKTGHKV